MSRATIQVVDLADPGDIFSGKSCVFGVFDGFHLGHRFMVDQALADSNARGTVAITFDRDPDELFASDKLKKLMTNDARIAALAASGIALVAVLPFSASFAALEPDVFLDTVFAQGVPARIHVGSDFNFGKKGAGHVSDLEAWGKAHRMQTCAHDLKSADGMPVTSTRIRACLGRGDVDEALTLLGHEYWLEGLVVHGRGQGHEFGFPTANLDIPAQLICVAEGVYGCRCDIDGVRYNAAVTVGVPPSFSEAKQPVEAHIIDFDGDLYGRTLALSFVQRIRPNRVMHSLEELEGELTRNVQTIRDTQPL